MLPLTAKYCPLCAGILEPAHLEGRERPRCAACGFVYFWNPACGVAAAVLDEAGRVLLIRRRIAPFRGEWALPAGYQEIDEDPRDTVLREVREETGIEIEVGELFDVLWVADDPRRPADVLVYLCRPVGGELAPSDDAEAAEWFHLDELPDQVGFDNRERVLDRLPRPDGAAPPRERVP